MATRRGPRLAIALGILAVGCLLALRLEDHARRVALDPSVRGSAILPPLFAIVLAFATRQLLPSLGLAIALGAILAARFDPVDAALRIADRYAWESILLDASKLWIVVFTVALMGTVSLVSAAGGVQALVSRFTGAARGPKSAQLLTFTAGFVAFFDDYTNAILLGTSMRPLFDRLRISRAKLAYLVDSTSAPIAGLAVISTWIGYEVGLFGDAAQGLGLATSGYEIFFRALPFRFYCYFALLFVLLNVLSGREFGPMRRAEARARGGEVEPSTEFSPSQATSPWVAILPIGLVLASTLLGLLWDGGGFSGERGSLLSFATWREVFGAADSTRILGLASLLGAGAAFALTLGMRLLTLSAAARAFGRGARSMAPALGILFLAWGLSAVSEDLGTSSLLVAALSEALPPALLPIATFLLASAIAFATGTSWGTMGILIPTVLPLAYHAGGMEVLVLCAAAVLDGAIFGDHVSPLSDTTLLSSIASEVEPLEHVRTQLPYALVAFFSALVLGHGSVAAGLPYALSWLLALAVIAASLYGLGRPPKEEVALPHPEAA